MKQDLIQKWEHAQEKLRFYKQQERELRDEVITTHFDIENAKNGVNNFELKNKYVLKYTPKFYTRLDKAGFLAIRDKLSEGAEDAAIKWVPELKGTAYTKLALKDLRLMNSVITITPGAPSLVLTKRKR